jgi:hypothetical protein
VIAKRILAVLAAMLLVGAVALATLGPPEVPLGQVMLMVDHDLTEGLHNGTERYLAVWIWEWLISPLLLRPAWLLPAALGLICAGISFTLSPGKPAHRSHRRS